MGLPPAHQPRSILKPTENPDHFQGPICPAISALLPNPAPEVSGTRMKYRAHKELIQKGIRINIVKVKILIK
jgi:hypothetical protein